ncbi:mannose-6-phosphate isomerase-like protein (cupin superfamily) [Herbihabitans rhizosphaerae]|uniref:Mannose-6-phosphate isomerase-like protein (Cupin superfamily) n=1 Tax=Herbihabitans rhizosphaerae TaxID=1872711 RepID=A0A4Q7L3E8_9PSEU|nr:cupin domain-containing protein [Herbihabitans rhizosphaerae]RZS43676.1 mannose-6-phosphate isomerase-like protein (cupin superfamily) [Herbihabitans rhizosphaerae]
MSNEPIAIESVLATFTDLWSPRILTRINDYDVRVAKVAGEFVWHTHDDTDEFFLVLDGELRIGVRDEHGERHVTLPRGSVFVVPRGIEHKPSSVDGATIMVVEPTGTPSTGDRHDALPEHITTTTGRRVA